MKTDNVNASVANPFIDCSEAEKRTAVMEQIGRLLFQEGFITLEEKLRFDAALKRL